MTKRLYYDDPYRTEFDARVVRVVAGERNTSGVILDQTYFYPTSGGQPSDRGMLAGQPVFDVTEENDDVVHWVAAPLAAEAVHGRITWPRRFDHMQQHTGQHILSQAFVQVAHAETVSFHLGEDAATIDVSRPHFDAADIEAVENLANEVLFQDRPVSTRFIDPVELTQLNLRKETSRTDHIRIVQIEGFDVSPCGGTHVAHTGEVGLIVIRKWERRGQDTRVEFLCGGRALRDYRRKVAVARELGLAFSVGEQDLVPAVLRLIEEANANRRLLHQFQEQEQRAEATALLTAAELWNGVRIVRCVLERDPQEVQRLARLLTEGQTRAVALLGASQGGGRLFFARSADLEWDMAALLRQTAQQYGGGGGGQSHLAQGGGLPVQRLEEALRWAHETLIKAKGGNHAGNC